MQNPGGNAGVFVCTADQYTLIAAAASISAATVATPATISHTRFASAMRTGVTGISICYPTKSSIGAALKIFKRLDDRGNQQKNDRD
ncbi:MAG: hypothetical protein EKK40_18910 [Bradyrhizobiaceae bacterium]|nr:MAG: hypothetical protein EKK40_18910 [Bradyrhizobiaceae bacterium]